MQSKIFYTYSKVKVFPDILKCNLQLVSGMIPYSSRLTIPSSAIIQLAVVTNAPTVIKVTGYINITQNGYTEGDIINLIV